MATHLDSLIQQPSAREEDKMDGIEKRVQQLEQANRRLTGVVLLLGLLLVATFFYPGAGSRSKDADIIDMKSKDVVAPRVIARELVIVDESGNPLARLGTEGIPGFAFLDLRNGRNKSHAKVESYGLVCLNGMDKSRVRVTGGDFSESGVFVQDEKGKTRLALVHDEGSEPSAYFRDSNDRPRLEMGIEEKNAFINYSDTSGQFTELIPIPQ